MKPLLVLFTGVAFLSLLGGNAPDAHARRSANKKKVGALAVNCSVQGAEIFVNGKRVSSTPSHQLALNAGTHTVVLKKKGYLDFKKSVRIRSGMTETLNVELLPFSTVVQIKSNVPGATVSVDGNEVGRTPLEVEVKLGSRMVKVSKPGFQTWIQRITAMAGKEVSLVAELAKLSGGAEPDDLALAPIEPMATAKGSNAGAQEDLALEMPPLEGGADPELPLEPPDLGNELALTPPPTGDGTLELIALPPGKITEQVVPPTPWYLQWYTLTGAAVLVAAAVIIPTVVVTTSQGQCQELSIQGGIWTPGESHNRAALTECR